MCQLNHYYKSFKKIKLYEVFDKVNGSPFKNGKSTLVINLLKIPKDNRSEQLQALNYVLRNLQRSILTLLKRIGQLSSTIKLLMSNFETWNCTLTQDVERETN